MDKDQEWDSVKAFALPPDFIHSSFTQATKITATDHGDNIYKADIKRDWCIGLVPHGGYITSIVATAVQFHFQTKHQELSQPDLITFHIEFLARTTPGPAELQITELKLGRQFSTVRAQLLQYPNNDRSKKPRICLEAVFTQGNLTREAKSGGISLPTKKVAGELYDIFKREDCEAFQFDERWKPLRPAVFKMDHWVPKGSNEVLAHPKLGPSVREEWVRWTTSSPIDARDQGFTPLSLPYVADAFRPLPEAYGLVGNWYPTLSYGLEVKKAPPNENGWEWLYLRVEMLVCKGGRFDLRLLILDEEGEVVALGNHVALAVSQERNMKVVEAKI